MASALDREFNKLEKIVDKYCIEAKADDAYECIEWARGYAEDFPEKADIDEAIRWVTKAEEYIREEGRPQYVELRESVVKRLKNLLKKKNS